MASAVALAAEASRPRNLLGAVAPPAALHKEYWVTNGDVRLYLYRKYNQQTNRGGAQPVLFLGHGSSITKLPLLDPKKAIRPFIILRGEYDGIATETDVIDYFRQAARFDRALRLISGATQPWDGGISERPGRGWLHLLSFRDWHTGESLLPHSGAI